MVSVASTGVSDHPANVHPAQGGTASGKPTDEAQSACTNSDAPDNVPPPASNVTVATSAGAKLIRTVQSL